MSLNINDAAETDLLTYKVLSIIVHNPEESAGVDCHVGVSPTLKMLTDGTDSLVNVHRSCCPSSI